MMMLKMMMLKMMMLKMMMLKMMMLKMMMLKMMMLKMMMLKMMMLKMMMPAWLFFGELRIKCSYVYMLVILFQLADRLVWQMFLDESKNTIQT